MPPDPSTKEADEKRLTPAVWAKWDAKLYNWALCGFAKGVERATVQERRQPRDEHWSFYVDGKHHPTAKGQANTWEADEPPGINADALDTESLVIQLSDLHREAVEAYWAMTGPMEYRASAIRCHVNTLRNRAQAAVVQLEIMDGARRAAPRRNAFTGRMEQPPAVVRRTRYVPDRDD